jgi:hypothetical protein
LRTWGSNNRYEVPEHIIGSPKLSGLSFFAESTVAFILYFGTLEEFLVLILEAKGLDGMLYQHNEVSPHFFISSLKRYRLAGAGLSLGQVVFLTLFP